MEPPPVSLPITPLHMGMLALFNSISVQLLLQCSKTSNCHFPFSPKDTKHAGLGDKLSDIAAIITPSAYSPYSPDWAQGHCQGGGTSSPLQSIRFGDPRAKKASMFRLHMSIHLHPWHRPWNRASLEMGSRELWSKTQFTGTTLLSFQGFWSSW